MMTVPMPDELSKDLKDSEKDEKLKKKIMMKYYVKKDKELEKAILLKYTKYQNYWFSLINNVIAFAAGIYYFFAYGLIVDQECNNFEFALSQIQISFFTIDFITSFFFGQNDMKLAVHHIMAVISYSTPFFYRRFGSECMMGMVIGELSGPFLALREILP